MRNTSDHQPVERNRQFCNGLDAGTVCPAPGSLRRLNVWCLLALRALRNFKRYFLTFLERLESGRADWWEVSEQILTAVIRGNKPKAFWIIEPFYCPSWHFASYTYQLIKKSPFSIGGRILTMFRRGVCWLPYGIHCISTIFVVPEPSFSVLNINARGENLTMLVIYLKRVVTS